MAEIRMPDLNMVMIVGNLTNNPIYNETRSGTPVVNFYIASNKRFKDRNGIIKEDVCFVGVVAWDNLAVSCRDNLKKGSAVFVTGELQSRKFETENGYRNVVEIKARKIQFLDKIKHVNNSGFIEVDERTVEDIDLPDDDQDKPNFGYDNLEV
jgi:single-strand DNA-binding protein